MHRTVTDTRTGTAVLDALDPLITALRERGYDVAGPRVRDGVIRFTALEPAADLPTGRATRRASGRYRLRGTGRAASRHDPPDDDRPVFVFAAGPDRLVHAWHGPAERRHRVRRPLQMPPVAGHDGGAPAYRIEGEARRDLIVDVGGQAQRLDVQGDLHGVAHRLATAHPSGRTQHRRAQHADRRAGG